MRLSFTNRGTVDGGQLGPAYRTTGQVVIDGHGPRHHGPAIILYPLLASTIDHPPLTVDGLIDPWLLWFIVASITNGINN